MVRKGEKKEDEEEFVGDEDLTEAEESIAPKGVPPAQTASADADKVGKDFEEVLDDANFGVIPESDIEVSDFSIGDVGLATANVETVTWKGNLETSLAGVPSGRWEEKNEERPEEGIYSGDVDKREGKDAYTEIERGSDFYTGGGRGTDLYSSDSENYNARDESGEFYDPRIGKRADTEGVRVAGKSKLEITGLQGGFGRGTEKDIRGRRDDKKYTN